MTYRLPRLLPFLILILAVVMIAGTVFGTTPERHMSFGGYLLIGCFVVAILVSAVFARTYFVAIGSDRLVVNGLRRREYLFVDMTGLEVRPGYRSPIAVITMRDQQLVEIPSYLRDFSGFVRSLRTVAKLEPSHLEDPGLRR
jgi:hypothetical protein